MHSWIHLLVQILVLVAEQWLLVQTDLATLRLVKPLQKSHYGALSCIGWTHQSGDLPRYQLQRNALMSIETGFIFH